MRRPRSKLEVSTFPFLAVLLCAMGSLLLLLFIMDRRAKIAAQNQVSETLAKRQARTKEEEDARQAEWEKARASLHATLLAQHGQLVGEANALDSSIGDVNAKLQNAALRHQDLTKKTQSESAKIDAIVFRIGDEQSKQKQAAANETKAKAEIAQATRELAELEFALQHLRSLKTREKPVYSLVPYRGKRGDARTPVYIECVRGGVCFQPDNKRVDGFDFTPGSIRLELERRVGALVAEKSAKEATPASDLKRPYVLFLVRPEGITSYYQASSALKGYELDFGYELIDQDWTLDYGDAKSPAPPHGVGNPQHPSNPKVVPTPPKLVPPIDVSSGTETPSKEPAFVPKLGVPRQEPIASTGNAGSEQRPVKIALPKGSTGGSPAPTSPTPPANEDPPETIARTPPSVNVEPKKRSPAPSPPRALPDRDFVITIECFHDRVTVAPGAMRFQWTAGKVKETDREFVEAITNLIEKRQASARPGDPPYRPVVRFRVSQEGLRSYYHAYPLLESLRIPMTRENVEE